MEDPSESLLSALPDSLRRAIDTAFARTWAPGAGGFIAEPSRDDHIPFTRVPETLEHLASLIPAGALDPADPEVLFVFRRAAEGWKGPTSDSTAGRLGGELGTVSLDDWRSVCAVLLEDAPADADGRLSAGVDSSRIRSSSPARYDGGGGAGDGDMPRTSRDAAMAKFEGAGGFLVDDDNDPYAGSGGFLVEDADGDVEMRSADELGKPEEDDDDFASRPRLRRRRPASAAARSSPAASSRSLSPLSSSGFSSEGSEDDGADSDDYSEGVRGGLKRKRGAASAKSGRGGAKGERRGTFKGKGKAKEVDWRLGEEAQMTEEQLENALLTWALFFPDDASSTTKGKNTGKGKGKDTARRVQDELKARNIRISDVQRALEVIGERGWKAEQIVDMLTLFKSPSDPAPNDPSIGFKDFCNILMRVGLV